MSEFPEMQQPQPGEKITSQREEYVVERILGKGAMGVVYKVQQSRTGSAYAMKLERAEAAATNLLRLKLEALAMEAIGERTNRHLLHLIDRGTDKTRHFNFIVIPLIGGSLDEVQEKWMGGQLFSKSTAMQIVMQTLAGIGELHDLGFFHRDIKPANLAIGLKDRGTIYLLDYGMCRYYRRNDGYVIHHRGGRGLNGTKNWASRRVFQGEDFCRADDVETWFYLLLVYLSEGKATHITEVKEGVDDNLMLAKRKQLMKCGPDKEWQLPVPVTYIWEYVADLHWYDRPDYAYLHQLLMEAVEVDEWCSLKEPVDWLKPDVMAAYEARKKKTA